MNLRTFEYLLALEKHGGFHRAAEACNVSQPALSIQIRKFEDEMGIQLLERSHAAFIFTPCGQEVLERARSVMQQVGEIEELAELWHDPYAGSFSLGAFPTLAPYYFPRIIDHLIDAYPNLQFNLVEDKTDAMVDRLKTGALDAAFLALPINDDGLEHGTIFTEEFFLGVPPNHRLAKRKTIDPKQLSEEKVLLLEEGHCLRGQALDYCANAGIGEVLNFRATSMETLLQMVSMGRGMSFIPDCVARQNSSIHYVRLKGGNVQRTVGLFWRKSHVRRNLMLELVDDLSREYGK